MRCPRSRFCCARTRRRPLIPWASRVPVRPASTPSVPRWPPRSTPRFKSRAPSRSCRSHPLDCTPSFDGREDETSFAVEVDPERAHFGFAMVLDLLLAAGAVGDEIALPQHMLGTADLNGQPALQHEAIFEAAVADRMLGAAGVGGVLVDGDRDSAAAVLAQQPAHDMLGGFDLARLRRAHHDLLLAVGA